MEIIVQNQAEIENLCRKYEINFLAVFGSTATGRDNTDSDVDLLVSFEEPVTLFELAGIEREFSNLFDREVDLITQKSLHPYIEPKAKSEMLVIYDQAA